jgi:hypothetical protein
MLISLVFIEQCTYEFIAKKWVIMATAESDKEGAENVG